MNTTKHETIICIRNTYQRRKCVIPRFWGEGELFLIRLNVSNELYPIKLFLCHVTTGIAGVHRAGRFNDH